jgi:hypothetical protein
MRPQGPLKGDLPQAKRNPYAIGIRLLQNLNQVIIFQLDRRNGRNIPITKTQRWAIRQSIC